VTAIVKQIWAMANTDPPRVMAVPVIVFGENGPIKCPLFRVASGFDRVLGIPTYAYVDNVGRGYDSLKAWEDTNRLPPGRVYYPAIDPQNRLIADGNNGLVLTSDDTPRTHHKIREALDTAAMVGCFAAGVTAVVVSGGTLAIVAAGVGTASDLWMGIRSVVDLHDRYTHGLSMSPLNMEALGDYLGMVGGVTGSVAFVGKIARAVQLGKTAASAVGAASKVATVTDAAGKVAAVVGVAGMVHQGATLAINFNDMPPEARLEEVLKLLAFGGLHLAGAARSKQPAVHAPRPPPTPKPATPASAPPAQPVIYTSPKPEGGPPTFDGNARWPGTSPTAPLPIPTVTTAAFAPPYERGGQAQGPAAVHAGGTDPIDDAHAPAGKKSPIKQKAAGKGGPEDARPLEPTTIDHIVARKIQALEESLTQQFGSDPAKAAAFENMINNKRFKELHPSIRLVVLDQVSRAADAHTITAFEVLVCGYNFHKESLADQAQSAKFFADVMQSGNDAGLLLAATLYNGSPRSELRSLIAYLSGKRYEADPAKKAAFVELTNSPDFQSLSVETRYALVRAVFYSTDSSLHADGRSFLALEQLVKRPWFREASPVDQYLRALSVLEILGDPASSATLKHNVLDVVCADNPGAEIRVLGDILRQKLKDPAKAAAFDRLTNNKDFQSLTPFISLEILDQISSGADALSIMNLERLIQRPWFRNAVPEHQRLSASLVKYLSQSQTGDVTTIKNTLDFILSVDGPKLQWENGGFFGNSYRGILYDPVPGQPRVIGIVIADMVRKRVADIAEALAHEICHLANNDTRSRSYRFFMAEYRAWYVSQVAKTGHPPSQQECWDRTRLLVTWDRPDGYGEIAAAFKDANSVESKKIVEFIARVRGDNPEHATTTSVLGKKQLSETRAGLSPERASPDDLNILNNHR
jgi:hypothetical protein